MTDARGPTGKLPGTLATWVARLGPGVTCRPPPSIGVAVAGAGGALAAAGVVVLGGQRLASSGSSAPGTLLAAGLLAAGAGAMVRWTPPASAAGVGATGVAAPALAFFVSAGGGSPSVREVGVLAGILLAALYAVGPWRGHTAHLSVLAAAGWVVALSAGDLGTGESIFGGLGTVGRAVSTAGAASMILGVVYLGLGSWLHDEGLEGVATPFLAVAALALPVGAVALANDAGGALQAAVALAAGAAVAFVGARCRRRGTTWTGLAVAVGALVAGAHAASERTAVAASLAALAGGGLVLLAPLLPRLVAEDALDASGIRMESAHLPAGDDRPAPPPDGGAADDADGHGDGERP